MHPRPRRAVALVLVATAMFLVVSCGSSGGAAGRADTVTLVTHDSFAVSKALLTRFERRTGIDVKVLKSGDAGAALNQAILTKDAPLGDAFFGVDNTFLSRALKAGIFVPYTAAGLDRVPAALRLDPRDRVTPIDYGDVCLNADRAWFRDHDLAVPASLDDLTRPAYRDTLVVENPATSSPGLAFVLATISKYGEDGWRDYWERLRANGVKVVDGWEQAYNTEFSGAAGKGDRPLVVSYASSPPAEVYYADPKPAEAPAEAPTENLPDTCFRQVEFAGVLRGADHPAAARKLVDFLLSEPVQADVPLQMFVFPARAGTPLPAVFTRYAGVPAHPFTMPAGEIGAHRDEWIDQWTATVLR
jgi:thiamine transport system substrate-binding protein